MKKKKVEEKIEKRVEENDAPAPKPELTPDEKFRRKMNISSKKCSPCIVPDAILSMGVSPMSKVVLICIMGHWLYPGGKIVLDRPERISMETRLKASTVMAAIDELIDYGLIEMINEVPVPSNWTRYLMGISANKLFADSPAFVKLVEAYVDGQHYMTGEDKRSIRIQILRGVSHQDIPIEDYEYFVNSSKTIH